jgi:hypothetical protein
MDAAEVAVAVETVDAIPAQAVALAPAGAVVSG